MNQEPLRPVSEAEIEAYERDGVVCLRGMFDEDWVTRMRNATLAYREAGSGRLRVVQKEEEEAQFYSNVFMCGSDPDFLAFRDESPAAKIGAALMRVDKVRFWYDQLFVKDPGTSAVTP